MSRPGRTFRILAINDSSDADPSLALVLGVLGWVVAMLAAAVALRRAGAGWPATVLVGLASFFFIHPPPVGPVALVCFAAAAVQTFHD